MTCWHFDKSVQQCVNNLTFSLIVELLDCPLFGILSLVLRAINIYIAESL